MSRVPPSPDEIREIYIDESSQTKNRFLILGGIILHSPRCIQAFEALNQMRLPELPAGEVKWGKVSQTKLAAYKRIVDAFWDHADLKETHFHSLFVDTSRQNHRKFNGGSREIGFSKEVFQISAKFGKLYPGIFHVYLDERRTSHSPESLRLILNRAAAKNGDGRDWPFRRCHFRDSKECAGLQLVDIFLGAIGYHINGHISAPDASPAKVELAKHVMKRAGINNPLMGTGMKGKFTIWERRLRD